MEKRRKMRMSILERRKIGMLSMEKRKMRVKRRVTRLS
jgi:hypothetical protein